VAGAGPSLGQILAALTDISAKPGETVGRVRLSLRTGRLVRVLERYAPTVPGFFLYIPSVARQSAPLRLFVEAAKELAVRAVG
jgi:hypothetical protein